jgi:DNA-binding sugar fermentation-stimulating protein
MCDARIRPFRPVNQVELTCEVDDDHLEHSGTIHDYAYPGSKTVLHWYENDRRTFHGEWPGDCPEDCILPMGHRGGHAP